jgi:hypothetical protein
MSLIHTCELNGANPFDYLNELQRHAEELQRDPTARRPTRNCRSHVLSWLRVWPERVHSGYVQTPLSSISCSASRIGIVCGHYLVISVVSHFLHRPVHCRRT